MRKFITWVVVLAIIAGGIGGFLWLKNQQQTQAQSESILRTAEVIRGDLEITVSASGNVAINDRLDLLFKQSGDVASLLVKENERVSKGQELARLDTTDLERAVRQAEIALEQAKLNLSTLQKPASEEDLELARLSLQSAAQALEVARLGKITTGADADAVIVQAQRARENAFKDYRSVSGTDKEENARKTYENAEEQERIARLNAELMRKQAEDQWFSAYNNYQQAQYNLSTLEKGADEHQIRQAELQIVQAELSLEQAQRNLDDAVLTSPFDGVVAAINIQQGILAPSGTPAITIIDDTAFYIEVAVDEMDISKVAIDQTVDVNLDAYPDTTLAGTVESIAPASTDIGGITAYNVRVRLGETGDARVKDGMTANVTISTSNIEDIVLIPNWAVRTDQTDNSIYCYRIENNLPVRVDITTGRRNDAYTEITSGLEPGTTVALVTESRNLLDNASEGPPAFVR